MVINIFIFYIFFWVLSGILAWWILSYSLYCDWVNDFPETPLPTRLYITLICLVLISFFMGLLTFFALFTLKSEGIKIKIF
jgi:hypothetical protein